MTEQRIPLGKLDVLIMGKLLPIRRAPTREQFAIAEALSEQMHDRIARRFDFEIEFGILEIRDGCIRVNYSLQLKLPDSPDIAANALSRYPDFKQATKAMWDEANQVIEYMAEGRACTARYAGDRLTDPERLYGPVPEGQALRQIAAELDTGGASREQVMIALFEANREQFIDDNLNLLRAGCVLTIPERAAMSGISVQRANMQVMKHQRRFDTRQRPLGDTGPI